MLAVPATAAGVIALPIHLPDDDRQLFLAVSRPGYGCTPWYLITTKPVYNAEQAWQIIFAYARRWLIEMSLRFTKSQMAFESPRLFKWAARLKFLLLFIAYVLRFLASGSCAPSFSPFIIFGASHVRFV